MSNPSHSRAHVVALPLLWPDINLSNPTIFQLRALTADSPARWRPHAMARAFTICSQRR